MAVIRNILVRIGADINGYQQNLNRASNELLIFSGGLNRGMSSVVSKLGLANVALAGFSAAAVTAFAVVSAKAIKSASDVIESENLFNASMGSMGNAARAWSEELSNSLGLNAYEVRRNVGLMYNMSSSLGVTRDKAYELSTNLTALAYDMSSFFNTSYEEMSEKILSAMTGQTKPMKELGVAVYETQVKQYAYANGIAAVGEELTETQKVMARYGVIMSQTKNAQGDMARTIMSPANQLRVLQTQLQLTMINLGMAFMPIWQRVLPALVTFANYLKYVSSMFASFMQAVFGKVIQPQSASISMADMAEATEDAAAGQEKLGKEAKKAKGALAGFDEINQLNDSDSGAGSGTGSGAGSAIGDAAENMSTPFNQIDTETFTAKIDTLKNSLKLFYEEWGMKDIVDGIKKGFIEFDYSGFVQSVRTIFDSINTIIDETTPSIKNASKSLGELIGTYMNEGITTSLMVLDIITKGVAKFYADNTPAIISFINDVALGLSETFNNVKSSVETIFDIIQVVLRNNEDRIINTVSNVGTSLFQIAETTGRIVVDMYNIFSDKVNTWLNKNRNDIQEMLNNMVMLFTQNLDNISKIVTDALDSIQKFWYRWGKDIFKGVVDIFGDLIEFWIKFYNDILAPNFEKALEWIRKLWDEKFKNIFDLLLEFVGKLANIVLQIYERFIKPIFSYLYDKLSPGFSEVIGIIIDVVGSVIGTFAGVAENVMKILNGLLDTITGVFSGDWAKAWEGIKEIFTGIIGGLGEILKVPLNAIIGYINTMINAFNRIKVSIPAVEAIGFKGYDVGFNLSNIPYLAKGGVIKGPTLAMLGESGAEAVVPLENTSFVDSIAGAVGTAILNAMQFSSGSKSGNNEVTIQIDSTKLARVLIPAIEKEKSRIGSTAIIQSV